MPDQSLLSTVRSDLADERDRLEAQIAALEPGHGGSADFDDNFADSGQVAAELGENKVLASQLRSELDEVERALAKLDDGTYGRCETCSEPIAEARLEAMPAARFCIQHA
jgi:DnaK suppressor protein